MRLKRKPSIKKVQALPRFPVSSSDQKTYPVRFYPRMLLVSNVNTKLNILLVNKILFFCDFYRSFEMCIIVNVRLT